MRDCGIRALPGESCDKNAGDFIQLPESPVVEKDERRTSNVQVSEDSDIERRMKKQRSTLGILGTLNLRHFQGLSG